MTTIHGGSTSSQLASWRRAGISALVVGVALVGSIAAVAVWQRLPGEHVPAVAVPDGTALWPSPGSGLTFDEPRAAVVSFAVAYAGFEKPVVGDFRAGDVRSGEIEVRPTTTGPVTTVLVRQFGSAGHWWVLGAVSASLQLESPAAMSAVTSPLRLSGRSTAFEANVEVEIRQDGDPAPLASGYVMGGSMGEMGPFEGTFAFDRPDARAGAVVLATHSMEDGRLWEISVVRIRYA